MTAKIDSFFGAGEGPIFMDQVACSGHENRLLDCPSLGLEIHDYYCNHGRDAGVVCIPGKG